jgi:peptidoglycan/LPS O-acetylase OafA/YrhL
LTQIAVFADSPTLNFQPLTNPAGSVEDLDSPALGAATSSKLAGAGRYHCLEAGRGVASLGVLLFHSLNSYPAGSLPEVLRPLKSGGGYGWLGVHVFFAISGWCIAERIARGFRIKESGHHFAAERFLRIFPTYWAALIATVAIRLASLRFNSAGFASCFPIGWQGWLGTALLLDPYVGRDPYLIVSWSLVYELGFYLCAALALVTALRRIANGTVLFAIGSLMCFIPWTTHEGSAPWRVLVLWPDFFSGVAAWWAARRGFRTSGFTVLALMSATAILRPAFWGIGGMTAIGTAWMLAFAYSRDARLAKVPVMRPLIWVGGISYSLYLIHVPIVTSVEHLMGRWIPYSSAWFPIVWIAAIVTALIGARTLNRFVEAPIERWRRRTI